MNELKWRNENAFNEWIVDLIFKKWKNMEKPSVFLRFLCEIELSLQSRAHFVDLIFKKWSEPVSSWRYFCDQLLDDDVVDRWNEALASVVRTLCRPHLQKVVRPRQFFTILCEIELSLQSRAHFVDHFPDRGAQPRKQTPSSGDHGQPLYPKKPRFFARESRQPWIHAFPRAHASQLLDDDVVDMMMWLTWWCDSWLWESFVIRKFPN